MRSIIKRRLLLPVLILLSVLSLASPFCAANRWSRLKDKYRTSTGTNRLIFVKYNGQYGTKLYMYKKIKRPDGSFLWKKLLSCRAYTGRNGIGKMREGDGKTPTGTFKITEAFGVKPRPRLSRAVTYTQLNPYLYWSGEEATYNTMVDSRRLGYVPAGSEHLIDYVPQYNYALNIGYNKKCTYLKGSAIFLHCMGSHPYTGGCVAVSEADMLRILRSTTSKMRICIYKR